MVATVDSVLNKCGQTYAEEAGIELADEPVPLYRLTLLTTLLSTRIQSRIAVATARELIRSGYGSPKRMLAASWQDRVDALGRGHYVRYDESTATVLGEGAKLVLDRYHGDLRRLRQAANGDPDRVNDLVQQLPRVGPVGADIFCREVQAVWPELRPYLDGRTIAGARRLGLPADREQLARLVPGDELARFAAALVRVSLDAGLAKAILRDGGQSRPERTAA